ncbi:hypothetical protein N0V87_004399 [Didymella glomerata]|uniref:Uncharacterized protein n=1 Tax=Didymella glomerata TaxID=749621 RepID=A0A9W9C0S7_9PLEO|nr:hypothetical protein N0V87_004399 [Didymella glomerata]
MSNWFGNLQLAYKYIVVFLALLVLTILAGCVKVLFDRRKLKQHVKNDAEAATVKEDTVELNQREKDEGDLFGIRAIEAGFYAGVAQSRPTSRAGSIAGVPNMSTSTLVANPNSPLLKPGSHGGSMVSLPLAGKNSNRDSETLPDRRPSPTMKLRPSDAEMNGRHNPYDPAVDMSLNVPPSPGFSIQPTTFGGSDTDSDGVLSPRSMSPRSADFNLQSYKPAPSIPMPDALRVSYHPGEEAQRSQAASINDPSPRPSPGQSPTPPSPGHAPTTRLPTLPASAMSNTPSIRVEEPDSEPKNPQSKPNAPTSTHQRDGSDASSVYSDARHSAYQSYQNFQALDRSNSSASVKAPRAPSHLLELPDGAVKEARLSEFYDAYYRQSQLLSNDAKSAFVDRQSTILEVESPLPSPLPNKTFGQAM